MSYRNQNIKDRVKRREETKGKSQIYVKRFFSLVYGGPFVNIFFLLLDQWAPINTLETVKIGCLNILELLIYVKGKEKVKERSERESERCKRPVERSNKQRDVKINRNER